MSARRRCVFALCHGKMSSQGKTAPLLHKSLQETTIKYPINQDVMMDFLFLPESPLFDFLEPFDLLKMLHFTKAEGRPTSEQPQTLSQQLMLDDWVNSPRATKRNKVFDKMKRKNCGNNLAGPLRLGSSDSTAFGHHSRKSSVASLREDS